MNKKKKTRNEVKKEQEEENNKLRNRMKEFIVSSQRSTFVQRDPVIAAVLHDPSNADTSTEPVAPNAANFNPSSESSDYDARQKTSSGGKGI